MKIMLFFMKRCIAAVMALATWLPFATASLGEKPQVEFEPSANALALIAPQTTPILLVDAHDFSGVVRAVDDLKLDFARVSDRTPEISNSVPVGAKTAIIIGTIGHSALIEQLSAAGKIDVKPIAGKWESFLSEVVDAPFPGVERALVIVGSDKRGTIFGIYDLSEQIGVSPWYWWADVPVSHHDEIFVRAGKWIVGEPTVKYRGIFLNDEAPDLTNWIREKFGTVSPKVEPPIPDGVANYGHEFYARLFEVMLRLRANYLWPAMWANAFNEDDPENARLADEYGIVMGTSHQEPMLRAQKEWDRRYLESIGHWNYAQHPEVLEAFWRDGIRRNRNFESIITLGLRGANDTEMAPGGPEANRALLEKIVGVQRAILREEINPDVTKVPQLWCLYKEVQDFYEAGMRAPDDVTLLWADDNWGNLRRLPTAEERQRRGGAGVYYHFDYHGGPRSYQWLNTSPIPKIWEQMSLAKRYGADRIWIVNVGHFKGYELPLEFFLRFAWNTDRWNGENLAEFTQLWAAREFGPEYAGDIADILNKYTKYNGRRKPEMLAPDTYSLVNYHEAERVVEDFSSITARAEKIFERLPETKRDAFYQLVLFPTKASALVNSLYLAAGENALYGAQGRVSANDWAATTRALFGQYEQMVADFDHVAGGKWQHFMDQPVLGYVSWRDPPANNLEHLSLREVTRLPDPQMGIAVEGEDEAAGVSSSSTHTVVQSDAGTTSKLADARLPQFDVFNQQRRFVDVFNRGKDSFKFAAVASEPWIQLSETSGVVEKDHRVWVSIDWSKVPFGTSGGVIKIDGAQGEAVIRVEAFKPSEITPDSAQGFVEGDGFVSIEPEHYYRKIDAGLNRWTRIEGYGRTLSGMRADAPVDAASATPGANSPCLEYRMYLFTTGKIEVTTITAPTLNFVPNRAVRYAISFDDEAPQDVTLVPQGYKAQNGNRDWEKSVADNAHTGKSKHLLKHGGYHTLKLWMVDPEVVLQKILVDLGGLKPSYLGPPESFRNGSRVP
jgi:hypothetical protein